MTKQSVSIVLEKFIKGFVAGAVSSMVVFYSTGSVSSCSDFGEWIGALSFAGAIGGIGGGLLALDKFFNLPETKEAIGKAFKK